MDTGSVGSSLANVAAAGQIDVGVLAALQNLDRNVAAELFASIGLGQSIDVRA